MYAKVVFGLAVEGPFDYFVPEELREKIKPGVRVDVSFNFRKKLGYVVALASKTVIKNTKPILRILDTGPLLDSNMLKLAKELSDYYCCSWGEAIETTLPEAFRRPKTTDISLPKESFSPDSLSQEAILIHAQNYSARWDSYNVFIEEALAKNKAIIILLSDIESVLKARDLINSKFTCSIALQYRKQKEELQEWLKIKQAEVSIVIGTRSAVFAPVNNLGLIIIEEEEDYAYKQDQVPHYHARELVLMRARLVKAKVILGSSAPSLESIYLVRKNKIKYQFIPRDSASLEVKVIDASRQYRDKSLISRYLTDLIMSNLTEKKAKTLLFLNRKGFATYAVCQTCGQSLKCPRCNINLVYFFKEAALRCHYCNFKIQPIPKICTNCNSGYIKYSGIGTEKLESELSRLFPQARIKILDDKDDMGIEEADIFIATQKIIRNSDAKFNLIGVLSIDNTLNHADLRSSEKAFAILNGLMALAKGEVVIQTGFPTHHCFLALEQNNNDIFYDEELKERRQLNFPPFRHLALVKLRARQESKAREAAQDLFNKLVSQNKDKKIKMVSVNPGLHPKLRESFYWQILLRSDSPKKITKFLKINLKSFKHSGIIVTVDVDPV